MKISGKPFPSAKAIHEDEAVAQSAQAEEVRSALALKQAEKAFPQEDEEKVKVQKPARFRTSAVKELMPRIDTDGNGLARVSGARAQQLRAQGSCRSCTPRSRASYPWIRSCPETEPFIHANMDAS